MKILIIEDENRNASHLKRLLAKIDPEFVIEGPLESVKRSVAYLQQEQAPDLILADIRLTDGLSFDALRAVGANIPVIFTTAYDEYAIRAFKYNGIDYLLKPIDEEELRAAIGKVRRADKTVDASLRQLLDSLQKDRCRYRERFLLPYRDGYETVLAREISFICTENRMSRLYLNDGAVKEMGVTLDELEQQLHPDYFFRINRQYIVHINSISHITNYFGGKLIVCLKGFPDIRITVSKDKAPVFKNWLDR